MYENELEYEEELYCVAFNEEHRTIKIEPMMTLVATNIFDLKPHEKKEGKIHYDPIGFAWGRENAEALMMDYLETLVEEYGEIVWEK